MFLSRSRHLVINGFLLFLFSCTSVTWATESFATENIERIHVLGQRNQLQSNALVDNNSSFTEFSAEQSVKPTIADWLALTPGLSLNGQGGLLQSYSIRGFSKSRVLTEVDGIPIYTDRRAGNSASFLPASLLQGFDVQKGPSSTLYGSNALGGVIHLKSVGFNQQFIAASTQTNDQHKEFTFAYGAEHWQSAISYRHANNSKSADGTSLNTHFEQLSLINKYKTTLNNINVKLTWIPSLGKHIGKSSSTYPDERLTEYPEELHSLFITELSQQQWYAKLYHHYQNWDTDSLRVNTRRNLTEYQAHTLGGSVLTSTEIFNGQARIGIDWINRLGVSIKETESNLSDSNTITETFSNAVLDGQQNNSALFSDIHWQWDNIGLAAGLRYDHISQRQSIEHQSLSDQQLNGSVLVNWQLSNATQVQAEFATGFRFPTLTELYFEGETPRGSTVGNAHLRPERSKGIQLALKHQATSAIKLGFDSYYYRMRNYIERFTLEQDVRTYRNLDKAYIYGFETSVTWDLSDRWQHQISYQWQQGQDGDKQVISDLQPATWAFISTGKFAGVHVKNQFSYRLAKNNVSPQELARPSFVHWRIEFNHEINDQTSVSVWGNNLLDKIAHTTADEDAPLIQGASIGIKVTQQL